MAVATIAGNPSAIMAMGPPIGQIPNQMVLIGDLLELAIKKTYRELLLLAELLPRKTDMERKIEIMLFANRNRQLYVRLLGLVRWASTASKVEKCSQIVSFLDKQSLLFTETADILARLSRETLVTARLPSFQLLAAVEVMTLGTYSRLPACIRDRLVPPKAISNSEKRSALLRLNHIIQQRLVASELPLQMRNIKIEFGRVSFVVQNEFELTLTLLSDNSSAPWRVLRVKIGVEDKEINGVKDLVPGLQIYYLQNLVQSRIADNSKPLVEAYNILHSFCLSLQLEVLHIQSLHLFYERLKDFIRIDDYVPGSRIVISYWKAQDEKTKYKLIIEIDSTDPSKPLQIKHSPELSSRTFAKSMQANILSIEKLLFFTTHERSKIKLINLKKLFEEKTNLSLVCDVVELPAVLHVSFIQPCMSSEQLLISIDMLTGLFLAHIPAYEDCPLINDIENCLNKTVDKIFSLLLNLRIWITRERCKKTVESLPVRVLDVLPFSPNYSHQALNDIHGHKIYFQFTRHQDKILMVAFDNDSTTLSSMWIEYYLLSVNYVSVENRIKSGSVGYEQETPKHYMQLLKLIHLDSPNISYNFYAEEPSFGEAKRKLVGLKNNSAKRQKLPGYYIAELAHIISFCEEKLAFSCLSSELHRREINHQIVLDTNTHTHYIDIIKFPNCNWCPPELTDNMASNTLSCTIRMQGKSSNKSWNVVTVFANPPINGTSNKDQNNRRTVLSAYDFNIGLQSMVNKMVEDLLQDWTAIARLYDVVQTFADDLKTTTLFNTSLIEIKSFTCKKIVIGYGPLKAYFISIHYKSSEKRFQLSFGVSNQAQSNTNPHNIVYTQLQQEFNQHLSVIQLLHVLNYTLSPLLTIQNLRSIPVLGVINSRPHIPVLSFCVVPQTSSHVRLIYRNSYCLDIVMHSDNCVSIRDGAFSQFDQSKAIEELSPIQGLKTFLSKFMDKSVQMRRLSQTEDDNPPSPVVLMDTHDNYMFSGNQIKTSPAKPMSSDTSNRNPSSVQHSNPQTPASPMTSVLNVHSGFVSSPGTFSLSPPHSGLQSQGASNSQVAPSPQMHAPEQSPANLFNINSPMNSNLHAPSPSFLPIPSPSATANFSHTQSPASQFLSQNTPQGVDGVGSPFNQSNITNPQSNMSLNSPATNIWPASPSISSRPSPRPVAQTQSPGGSNFGPSHLSHQAQFGHSNITQMQSRCLPTSKPWAANLPTTLSHGGFEMMCRPNMNSDITYQCSNIYFTYSQLERFLGSTSMRKSYEKILDDKQINLKVINTMEPNIIAFNNETMQFRLSLDTNTMHSIHLWISPLPDVNQWSKEELDTLQQFFENRVACAPYKPNAFMTFTRMLSVNSRILRDFIRLMKLDMYPDQSLKWSVHFCVSIPPYGNGGSPGMSACLIMKNKVLIFIQLSRNQVSNQLINEPITITVPLIYDISANGLSIGGERYSHVNVMNIVSNILKRFSEYNASNMDCTIYAAIRDLMANLQYPNMMPVSI